MSENRNVDDVEQLVRAYVAVRDELDRIAAKAKSESAPLNESLDTLERKLHDVLAASKVDSIKTSAGTAFFKKVERIKVDDWDSFFEWALAEGAVHFFVRNVARDPVKEYVEEFGRAPVGIGYEVEKALQIRRPK